MNEKKKTTYYEDQLAKITPREFGEGVSFKFFRNGTSTKQMDLHEDSAKAIVDLLIKLGVYNPNPQELLEQEYAIYDQGTNCSEHAFRTILAYKYWQDGAEWPFVCEVWFKDPEFSRERCMQELNETFNYGGDM
jgi:hypothetical protein